MQPVPGIEHLSPQTQMLLTAIAFVLASAVYFRGFFKKPDVEVSKDVVVPTLNVMDGAILRQAIDELRSYKVGESGRLGEVRELARVQKEQTDLLREQMQIQRRMVEILSQMDERLLREHQRLREGH